MVEGVFVMITFDCVHETAFTASLCVYLYTVNMYKYKSRFGVSKEKSFVNYETCVENRCPCVRFSTHALDLAQRILFVVCSIVAVARRNKRKRPI